MLSKIQSFLNALPLTWLILALPAIPFVKEIFVNERYYAEIMYETGLLAVQFTVLALAVTPLMRLFRRWNIAMRFIRWFLQRRRAIGIAAFGYALLHTYFYVRELGSLELVILDLEEWYLLTGWLAFVIFLALALTSNAISVKRLGRNWKILQRGAYLAAGFTALHWYLVGQFQMQLLVWFLPIALLQLTRFFQPKSVRTQV